MNFKNYILIVLLVKKCVKVGKNGVISEVECQSSCLLKKNCQYCRYLGVGLLLVKCYDNKMPGQPLTTFSLCILWKLAGQQKKIKIEKLFKGVNDPRRARNVL